MKINKKRDEIGNIDYGTVIAILDEFGNPDLKDPMIVVNDSNCDYEIAPIDVLAVSLNDGCLNTYNQHTMVEIVNGTFTINEF